ncbi:MAG: hypothetical protein KME45_11555 [Stenomitos rutilans HA7619-LM2]|jgi:multidrug resistance efflux pump|nr:hypothetical protein [Stenomitos rutilans HA7619-LM2]
MPIDASFITAVGGLASGAFAAYWTVKTYYQKRQDEQRDRQRQELAQAQAEIERQKAKRQSELDRYAEGKTKAYAAERDFQHLMRQYDALNINLTTLHEFQEKRVQDIEDDLRTIKGLLQALLIASGQTETGIMRYLKREE